MRRHPHASALIFAGVMLTGCLALAACGLTTGTGGTDTGAAPASGGCGAVGTPASSAVSTGVVTVVGTGSAQSGAGSAPPTGAQANEPPPAATLPPLPGATVTPGQLLVTTSRATYRTCDPIQVVIANGLNQTVYAADHQTACTVVTLQEQVGAGWQSIGECKLETPTGLHAIAQGTAVAQTLTPGFGSVGGAGRGWPAGTYRVAFAYSTALESPYRGQSHTDYSPDFTVS